MSTTGDRDRGSHGVAAVRGNDAGSDVDVEKHATRTVTQDGGDDDGDDGGGKTPTPEELKTLRHVAGRLPWVIYPVAFVEMCERMSYCGTVAVCEYPLFVSHDFLF